LGEAVTGYVLFVVAFLALDYILCTGIFYRPKRDGEDAKRDASYEHYRLFATTPAQVSLVEEYARHQRPIDDEFERRWEVAKYRTF
jgi:hypothetical protein